jgi:CRP-like cAMP-binding protein
MPTQCTDILTIENTIFGEHLSPASLKLLVAPATTVELAGGQFLFREGTKVSRIYVLLAGQIDLTMNVPGRGAVRILSLGPGELIAWSGVLGDGVMTCSATSADSTRLIAFESQAIKQLCETTPEFGFEFMKLMATALAKRLMATRLQLLDLFSANR